MLKKVEIEKVYTEKCMEYMAKGYRIDLENANVSFGGYKTAMVMKDDKGKCIAISLKENNDWRHYKSDMVLTVETIKRGGLAVWLGEEENEVIEQVTFYGVAEDVWTADKEASEQAWKKRYERLEIKWDERRAKAVGGKRAKETAVKVMKNRAGYKRLKADSVEAVKKSEVGYRIVVNGKDDIIVRF